jgi:hypothetical protein
MTRLILTASVAPLLCWHPRAAVGGGFEPEPPAAADPLDGVKYRPVRLPRGRQRARKAPNAPQIAPEAPTAGLDQRGTRKTMASPVTTPDAR